MVNVESLVTQANLENQENLVILVDQENKALQDDLAKMMLMETNIIAPSALEPMHEQENLATQENQENVDLLDLLDHLENLVMMPNATLENMVKMANLEGLDGLEKTVHPENLAVMVALEMRIICTGLSA